MSTNAAGSTSFGRSTKEDIRMLAFFDALVQRDINGVSDDENDLEMISYTNVPYPYSSSSDEATSNDEILGERNKIFCTPPIYRSPLNFISKCGF